MKKTSVLLIVASSLLGVYLLSYLVGWGWIEFFELKVMDLMYRIRGERNLEDPHVVVVAIDEKSLGACEEGTYSPEMREYTRDYWPWSREKFGRLIRLMQAAGAKAVLIDISFTTPSEEDPRGDSYFTSAVISTVRKLRPGVVIGTYLINSKRVYMMYGEKLRKEIESLSEYYWRYAYNMGYYKELATLSPIRTYKIRPPFEKLAKVAPVASFEVGSEDVDGKIRTIPLFIEEEWAQETGKFSGFLPHMDVLGVAFYYGVDAAKHKLLVDFKRRLVVIPSILGKKFIPFDSYGLFHLYYYGKGPDIFPTVSFIDVYKGNINLDLFKDKIVIVGYTATAKGLYDLRHTPFSNNEAGVYIHATAVENMIRGDTLRRIPMVYKLIMIISTIVLAGILLMGDRIFVNASSFLLVPLLLIVGYLSFSNQLYVDVFYPMFSSIIMGVFGISMSIYRNVQERKRFREYLYRYLDSSVADRLIREGVRELENERKKVVVLFSDIRGFTKMSEKMDPQDIVNMLNVYFDRMSQVIKKHGGMIDKFVGDAIMAVFGVPYEREDDVIRSLKCALEMREELKKLNEEMGWNIDSGIGLHYGEVVVGNIGASFRWDYTCIGDTVNTASRIESLTRKVENPVLVSEVVYEMGKELFEFEYVGEFQVKGKSELLRIYGLLGVKR